MPTTQTLSAMGFQGVVGVGIETTAGTAVAPTVYIPATDSNIDAKNKFVARQPIRKSKGRAPFGDGQVEVSGGFTTECNPNSLGVLLGLALGKDVVSGSAAPYLHTFTLASPLNTATVSVDPGKGTVHQYTGCKVDSLDLSVKPGDILTAKLGFVGITDVPLTSALSPSYGSVEQPFQFEMLNTASAATINGVNFNPEQFQITLKNNLKPYFAAGSGRFASNINETEANVSGSITVQYTGESIMNLLYGGSTGPVASGVATFPIVFTFTHPTTGNNLTITLGKCLMTEAPIALKKNDVTLHTIKFEAFEATTGAADDLKIALQSTSAVSYVS